MACVSLHPQLQQDALQTQVEYAQSLGPSGGLPHVPIARIFPLCSPMEQQDGEQEMEVIDETSVTSDEDVLLAEDPGGGEDNDETLLMMEDEILGIEPSDNNANSDDWTGGETVVQQVLQTLGGTQVQETQSLDASKVDTGMAVLKPEANKSPKQGEHESSVARESQEPSPSEEFTGIGRLMSQDDGKLTIQFVPGEKIMYAEYCSQVELILYEAVQIKAVKLEQNWVIRDLQQCEVSFKGKITKFRNSEIEITTTDAGDHPYLMGLHILKPTQTITQPLTQFQPSLDPDMDAALQLQLGQDITGTAVPKFVKRPANTIKWMATSVMYELPEVIQVLGVTDNKGGQLTFRFKEGDKEHTMKIPDQFRMLATIEDKHNLVSASLLPVCKKGVYRMLDLRSITATHSIEEHLSQQDKAKAVLKHHVALHENLVNSAHREIPIYTFKISKDYWVLDNGVVDVYLPSTCTQLAEGTAVMLWTHLKKKTKTDKGDSYHQPWSGYWSFSGFIRIGSDRGATCMKAQFVQGDAASMVKSYTFGQSQIYLRALETSQGFRETSRVLKHFDSEEVTSKAALLAAMEFPEESSIPNKEESTADMDQEKESSDTVDVEQALAEIETPLNEDQKESIRNFCAGESRITSVVGPPGTGKTQVVCGNFVTQQRMDPMTQTLVLATSNTAVHRIVEAYKENWEAKHPVRLVHIIAPSLPDDIKKQPYSVANLVKKLSPEDEIWDNLQDYFFELQQECTNTVQEIEGRGPLNATVPHKELLFYLDVACKAQSILSKMERELSTQADVILATVSLALCSTARYKDKFDGIILDEASQVTQAQSTALLKLLKPTGRMQVIGDPKQLGVANILSQHSTVDDIVAYTEQSTTLLDKLVSTSDPKISQQLKHNYRSANPLIEFVNARFYKGELQASREVESINGCLLPDSQHGIVFFDMGSNPVTRSAMGSLQNKKEEQAITDYVNMLLNKGILPTDIMVLSYYRAQAEALQTVLPLGIFVETVDRGQGMERAYVLISTVRSRCREIGFVDNTKRFNVASTRASKVVAFFGDRKFLMDKSILWREFLEYLHHGINKVIPYPFQGSLDQDPRISNSQRDNTHSQPYPKRQRVVDHHQHSLPALSCTCKLCEVFRAEVGQQVEPELPVECFFGRRSLFSNHYRCDFTLFGQTEYYTSVEQAYFRHMAELFNQPEEAAKIMSVNDPAEVKRLGNQLKWTHGGDGSQWYSLGVEIMYYACSAKFRQTPVYAQALKQTGESILAEASPYDTFWGTGVGKDDPRAKDWTTWTGTNHLGQILMLIRQRLRNGDDQGQSYDWPPLPTAQPRQCDQPGPSSGHAGPRVYQSHHFPSLHFGITSMFCLLLFLLVITSPCASTMGVPTYLQSLPLMCSTQVHKKIFHLPGKSVCKLPHNLVKTQIQKLSIQIYKYNHIQFRSQASVCQKIKTKIVVNSNFFGTPTQKDLTSEIVAMGTEECEMMIKHRRCSEGPLVPEGKISNTKNELQWE